MLNLCPGCGRVPKTEIPILCERCYDACRARPSRMTDEQFIAKVVNASPALIPSRSNRELVAVLAMMRRGADFFIENFGWTTGVIKHREQSEWKDGFATRPMRPEEVGQRPRSLNVPSGMGLDSMMKTEIGRNSGLVMNAIDSIKGSKKRYDH